MAAKRKLGAMAEVIEEPIDPADELMFLCLGGGNEVGRSCHIIQYKGKTIMVSLLTVLISNAIGIILTGLCYSSMLDNTLLEKAMQLCPTSTNSTLAPSTYCSLVSKCSTFPLASDLSYIGIFAGEYSGVRNTGGIISITGASMISS